jgi:hypothetical protein
LVTSARAACLGLAAAIGATGEPSEQAADSAVATTSDERPNHRAAVLLMFVSSHAA